MATIHKINEIKVNADVTYDIGYKQLDNFLNSIKDGSIITIGARPGMGKSTFVNNIVLNLLAKYNLQTLFINLETNKETVMLRLATTLLDKSFYEVKQDEELTKECILEFQKKNYNLYLSDDCYYMNDLEKLILENKDIKFLVIDYIQLLRSEKTFNSPTDNINDVLERLRILANKYNLVIFLISQVSRKAAYRENSRPILADLSSSSNLEHISDTVIFLYRDSYYNQEIKNNIMEIIIAKNRYGSTGITQLDYDIEKAKFINY